MNVYLFFARVDFLYLYLQEAYLEPNRTYTMEPFCKKILLCLPAMNNNKQTEYQQ